MASARRVLVVDDDEGTVALFRKILAAGQWEVETSHSGRDAAFSGPCALLGYTIGEAIGDPHAWTVVSRCGEEAAEVARASSVSLGFDDAASYVRDYGLSIPGARGSLLLDLTAGRPTEIDFINGAIPRLGREVGVAAPYNEAITALVKAREAAALRPQPEIEARR